MSVSSFLEIILSTSRGYILKPQHVSVLLNFSSGTTVGKNRDDLRKDIEAAFRKHDIGACLEFLSGPDLHARADQTCKSVSFGQTDAIIVGGGDGSIRSVASAMVGTEIPLGILPLGTLNHFAKDLKIPLSIEDAVAVIAAGHAQPIDAGEVNGEIFINNSSIGIYPYLVLDRDRRRHRQGLPKWLAMLIAAWRAFRSLPLRRLKICAESWQEICRSPCVFIGNNEYNLNGPSFGSRERLNGGELCLCVAKPQSRLRLLWLVALCFTGRMDQSRDLRRLALPAVEVSSRRRRLTVAFDGEIQVMQTPLHYRIRPKAIRVFVPSPIT